MPEKTKSDGYKFAVTFIIAISSIIYTIFNYFQNAAVINSSFIIICAFVSIGIIIAGGFLLYILIKGFAMEVEDQNHLEHLNKIANQIYQSTIILFFILIIYFISYYTTIIIVTTFNLPMNLLIILFIPLFAILLIP